MRKKQKNTLSKRIALALPLLVVSFLFVFTAKASGIVPDDVIVLANNARSHEGLNPLIVNSELTAAAQAKAEDMLKNDYFSHTSPRGLDPWYWMKQAGYNYAYAGENLATNYSNAEDQHNAWMKSTTHRSNILNARYQEIGVATVEGKINGKVSIVTVELFGKPAPVAADQSRTLVPPAVEQAVAEAAVPLVKGAETANIFLDGVQRHDMAQVAAILLLLLTFLLAPLAFLHETVRVLIQMKREKATGKLDVADADLSSSFTFDTTHHQDMNRNTHLIHDIRAG